MRKRILAAMFEEGSEPRAGAPVRVKVDGVEAVARVFGEIGDGLPGFLLIHGAGMDHAVWEMAAGELAGAGWSVVAPDLPGHGESDGHPLVTIGEMATWVGALARELGLRRPIVAGHSMGSLVALEAAAAAAGGCSGAVLVATADRMSVHPALLDAADNRDPAAVDMIVEWSVSRDGDPRREPGLGGCTPLAARRILESNLDRSLAVDLQACDRHRPIESAAKVGVPVLVVSATADRMTRATAARNLAEHIADVSVVEVDGGSHLLVCEDPVAVARPMIEWAERVTGRGS